MAQLVQIPSSEVMVPNAQGIAREALCRQINVVSSTNGTKVLTSIGSAQATSLCLSLRQARLLLVKHAGHNLECGAI